MRSTSLSSVLLLAAVLAFASPALAQRVGGELRLWHRVVVDFQGPLASESSDPNPFTDCRLNVTFTSPKGKVFVVPGYFTAVSREQVPATAVASQRLV